MKNKIILVNTLPSIDYWEVNKEPIIGVPHGLLCIGTFLAKSEFEVVIIDSQVEKEFLQKIKENLSGSLFIGLSVMTAGVASALQISEYIRNLDKTIPIVWGGIHPTLFPEETLADSLVDIAAWGEGEETALDLANALKKAESLERVKSIGFKTKEGKPVFTEKRGFVNLEAMPFTDYGLLDMEKYLYRNLESLNVGIGRVKLAVVHSSRGCPFHCTFCINTHPSQCYRSKSFERLMLEVDHTVKEYDPDVIYLQDDNFFANKSRTFKFFDEYEKRKYRFRWFSLTRANYFNSGYLSDEFVARISRSCLWLGMGVESGSERIRKFINKEISEDQVLAASRTLGKYHVPAGYAFMVGLPDETREEMLFSLSLMKKIKTNHAEAQFSYQYYRPYPGSLLCDFAVQTGFVPPKTLRDWASCQDTTGYSTLENLPWIKKSFNFVKYLIIFVSFVINDYPLGKKFWPYKTVLNISFWFRKTFGFWWGCGLEASISDFFKELIKSARARQK
ncbi:MAG: radical SAM protein [Smithella sp.]|nr:radical SAM protein [Smithella sp.]